MKMPSNCERNWILKDGWRFRPIWLPISGLSLVFKSA